MRARLRVAVPLIALLVSVAAAADPLPATDAHDTDGTLTSKTENGVVLRKRTGSSGNPFAFTGHELDDETGLYYAKARFYDPEVGRFLTQDPVRGQIIEPRSLHPYLYAYANPTVYVDPDGRCVGSLQKTSFCQTIARGIAYVLEGDPVARAEREIKIREKVVEGRRQFRAEMGREPRLDEVVWREPGREYTSSFGELDTTGQTWPDHAEWNVVGAGVTTRIAVNTARAAGAGTGGQVTAAVTQLGDEAVGEITGVSPSDVADVARFVDRRLSPPSPSGFSADSGVYEIVEGSGIGVRRVPADESANVSLPSEAANTKWARSGHFSDQSVNWTATRPKGTGQTYEVLQRVDIDWSRVRTGGDKRFIGRTNAEAARAGLPPQLNDDSFATLHHVGQDARGPLVEASTSYHGVGRPG